MSKIEIVDPEKTINFRPPTATQNKEVLGQFLVHGIATLFTKQNIGSMSESPYLMPYMQHTSYQDLLLCSKNWVSTASYDELKADKLYP